jgi:hypothetical protein
MIQKSTDQMWVDESGTRIPYNRTTKVERLMEKQSARLLREAQVLNKKLQELKKLINDVSIEAYEAFMNEKGIDTKDRKGNFTWYNFDRSIKVEVAINEAIKFDDMTIGAAKEKLDQFLNESIDSKVEFVKDLIFDAFNTSRGKLDAGKVLGLLKYRSKIKHQSFTEAMDLIEQSVRRPSSRTYYRIWTRDDNGKYSAVELNFSAI